MASNIAAITRIPLAYLQGDDLEKAIIAQRMSWVSHRKTTKAEDRVYCLLSIFDIHMPLLYGEREPAAFKRLQYEIMKGTPTQASSHGFVISIIARDGLIIPDHL